MYTLLQVARHLVQSQARQRVALTETISKYNMMMYHRQGRLQPTG